ALEDAGNPPIDCLYVGNMLSGEMASQEHLGALIADYAALEEIEAVKVEAACGSGAAAFRQALLAVASGSIETAVVVGVEKLTERSIFSTTAGLVTAADAEYEAAMGLSFVAINALLMRRYLHEYGYQKEDFAPFIILAHQNAQHNPNAMFRHPVSHDQYAAARMIATPINLLDSSPVADGAAAVVITSRNRAPDSPKPISILACETGLDSVALDNREDPLWLKGVERSVRKAFQVAGVTHKDIDLFELHDAFSIMTALSLESSGFSERGKAVRDVTDGRFRGDGDLPITTMGGLKGRGHPVGATGVYQIVEAVQQLRGIAPEPIQVSDARIALTQNIGGSGATVISTILANR
ncbi:MAG: thiolase domain-containing protein, partial [Calditrichaeota bacterium]